MEKLRSMKMSYFMDWVHQASGLTGLTGSGESLDPGVATPSKRSTV